MNEDRLLEIETKLTFQEKTIKDLNDELYQQQQEIDRLKLICEAFLKQSKAISELTMGIDAPANEKPPHY
ncbi:MAG: SlyX family protein [Pseudomonadota bacterium]